MNTKKNQKKKNSTLKNKINKEIFKNGDICCESNIKRKIVVEMIFNNYMEIDKLTGSYKDEYLDWMQNDLLFFIGSKVDLINNNDKYGLYLSKMLEKITMKNNKVSKELLEELLMELPLYYLLAFLGYSSYYKYTSEKSNNNFGNFKKKYFFQFF